ncbi:MAG: PDZ domain-containing protein, partial [Actinobacteria bacterium]|nr:PDZ domain-containing protein [Actinomycetota bacterium]
ANQLNLKGTTGAVVQRVEPGSPADGGGVQQGDVILKVGDTTVKQAQDVGNAVRGHRPGDKITLIVNRGGSTRSIGVTLVSRPENLG